MAPNRRLKSVIGLTVFAILITIYITSAGSLTESSAFYTRTEQALAQKNTRAGEEDFLEGRHTGFKSIPGDSVQQRLTDAAVAAKKAADVKGTNFHGQDVKAKAEQIIAEVPTLRDDPSAQKDKQQKETDERVEEELNHMLKLSNIIIFSKTYCPHSQKAKKILLEDYIIDPPPYVVELDTHELGRQLQDRLAEITGRKTVPNILVASKSIGGGDDIQALHDSNELIDKIRTLTGKRVAISAVR